MAAAHYDKVEEDSQWMKDYGCVRIVEENDADEKSRPLWKQLMIALERGDELVISKFSNAIRGARELAMFLEFCRVKVIRVISIHDRIDSKNELFPETKPSDVLMMIGSLPDLIERENAFNMEQFAASVNEFLTFRRYALLPDKGKISREEADRKAEEEYKLFNPKQKIDSDFDKEIRGLFDNKKE